MKRSVLLSKTTIIIIIACALIVMGGVFSRYTLMKNSRQDIEVKMSTTLNTTLEAYQSWTTDQIVNIQQWPRNASFRSHLKALLEVDRSREVLSSHDEQRAIRELMRGWLTDYGYQGFFIIAPDGTNMSSTRDSNLAQANLVKQQMPDLFAKVLAGKSVVTRPLFNDVEIGLAGGSNELAATMFAMIPVYNDGEVIAIFSVRLNPYGSFSAIFQGGSIGVTGETYIFDNRARMLSESRFNKELQGGFSSSTLNVEIRDPAMLISNEGTGEEQHPLTLMAQSALAGNRGSNLDGYNDYRGVEVIGTWIWDAERQIAIATEIDESEAYGSVRTALNTLYTFAGICIAILLLALYASFMVRRRFAEVSSEVERKQQDVQRILDAAGEGIYGLDMHVNATFINATGCKILGYSEEEIIGQNMHDLVHHSYRDGTPYPLEECQMQKAFLQGETHSVSDEVFWRKDGTPVPISYTITQIWDKGELTGAVIIFRDITEDIVVKNALEDAKEGAVSANKAKSTFLSSMSHELRTPLNAILGFGQILRNDPKEMTEQQGEYLGEIVSAGSHLLNLINDILELSKIEAGEMTLSLENIHVEDVIDDCVSMVSMLAARNGITITNAGGGGSSPKIYSDFLRTKQVLINLLSNAIKYNKIGGSVTILVSQEVSGFLRVSITDTGIGIEADRLEEMWQPFSRMGAETTNIEGSGIGLSVTKKVVDVLGGNIGVESEPGKGSTFWFEIPLAKDFTYNISDNARVFDAMEREDRTYDFAEFSALKILYVEDTQSNRAVIKSIFDESTEVDLCLAHTAQEGLDRVADFNPDVILLDINLPDFDGFEFKVRLREMDGVSHISVIALTANVSAATQEKAKAHGFADFLSKPVLIADLHSSLSRLKSS